MELPNLSAALLEKARKIKLLIMDVDGVLTDGKVSYSSEGQEIKSFNIKDGLGIKLLQKAGIDCAIITGRNSPMVERRAKELGISHYFQGHSDKREAFKAIATQLKLTAEQVAHVGDDLPDLPLMRHCGLGIAVADANWFVKEHADWITTASGGNGAIREVTELLLLAAEKLETTYQAYLEF